MLLALILTSILTDGSASPLYGLPNPLNTSRISSRTTDTTNDATATRDVITIIYNCIATIFACTYAAIHPNIPPRNEAWWVTLGIRLKITLYALIAPEILILWAMRQRIMAGRIADQFKDPNWTRAHGFFLQMGGFMLKTDTVSEVMVYSSRRQCLKTLSISEGIEPPRLPEADIADRNKRDYLSKALVIIQTTWFLIQCIARGVQNLSLTGLELVTLGYVVLNWLTYFLWWDKPDGIGRPMHFNLQGVLVPGPDEETVKAKTKPINPETIQKRSLVERVLIGPFAAIFKPFWDMIQQEEPAKSGQDVGPFYAAPLSKPDRLITIVACGVIGVIFGAIHMVGWSFVYPTLIEEEFWQAASIAITAVPALVSAFEILVSALTSRFSRMESTFQRVWGYVVLPLLGIISIVYTIARFYLIVQPFVGLRCLEPSAFLDVDWNKYIPHIQ